MGEGGGGWGRVGRMVTPSGLQQLGGVYWPGQCTRQRRALQPVRPASADVPDEPPSIPVAAAPASAACPDPVLAIPPPVHQVLRIATELLSVLKYLGGLRPPGALRYLMPCAAACACA